MEYAPLVITSSTQNMLKDGKIKHGAPTAYGMSGGPIFFIFDNDIEVLGVDKGRLVQDQFIGIY